MIRRPSGLGDPSGLRSRPASLNSMMVLFRGRVVLRCPTRSPPVVFSLPGSWADFVWTVRPDRRVGAGEWVEQDSNLRRHSHQIYSLAPLATWVSTRFRARFGVGLGPSRRHHVPPGGPPDARRSGRAGGESRTHNRRFTKPVLCRLSYASGPIAVENPKYTLPRVRCKGSFPRPVEFPPPPDDRPRFGGRLPTTGRGRSDRRLRDRATVGILSSGRSFRQGAPQNA